MIWIIIASVIYGVAIVLAAVASRNANTTVVAAILNTVSAVIPIAVAIPLLEKKTLQQQKYGLIMAVATGVLIAFFVMAVNKAYAVNKVGIVAPAVFGGAIFLSTAISYFALKEKISLLQAIGLLMLAIGFGVIIYARATGK